MNETTSHMKRTATFFLAALLLTLPAMAAEPQRMEDVAAIPAGQFFRVEREAGKYRFGDSASIFAGTADMNDLTFDVSNLRVLGNMGEAGQLKAVTIYRDSYRHCAKPESFLGGFSGVWTAKDLSSYGPYCFTVELDRTGGKPEAFALNEKLPWDWRIVLLDNLFPMAELKEPAGRFTVRLLTFAPVSADGAERPAGLVYHLWLENTGTAPLTGAVKLPALFGSRPEGRWAWKEPYEFEVGFADGATLTTNVFKSGRSFSLKPGETLSLPLVVYMPGSTALEDIQRRGELAWFSDTWRYHRALLGRLQVPGNPWLAEFHERELLQALGSLALGPTGKLAGSNWGTYPATRQIWAKDTFYSAMPLVSIEPRLAAPIIDWFHENGVRHPGQIVEGGLNHSISLSVASLMLAGKYFEHTGDAAFFRTRPGLRKEWETRLDALDASRRFADIHLYPTRYISDGRLEGDFHCGSNIAVWHALKSFARLLAEVYGDSAAAKRYAGRADQVKADILKRTVIAGKFGPQFIEGINRDGSVPAMTSDGEESETVLIPYYGFLPNDDATYLNYMRFSMSPENKQYTPQTRSINWGTQVPATAPGYNKGLCAALDRDSLFGEHGYYTEIRRVTEADGSVWWWPVKLKKEAPRVEAGKTDADKPSAGEDKIEPNRGPGKAGWFAGVHSVLFVDRFLGLRYDAPRQTLRFTPHPAIGDFAWTDFPMGRDRFSVSYRQGVAAFKNSTAHPVTFAAGTAAPVKVPAGETATVTITK